MNNTQKGINHYSDIIISTMASQINSLTIVYSTVYSGADQRKKSKLRATGLCEGNPPVVFEVIFLYIFQLTPSTYAAVN